MIGMINSDIKQFQNIKKNKMIDYLDNKGKKIEKGFYRFSDSKYLTYFTGNYCATSGAPIFEKESEEQIHSTFLESYLVRRLERVSNKQVKEIVKELKGRLNFLEEKLK